MKSEIDEAGKRLFQEEAGPLYDKAMEIRVDYDYIDILRLIFVCF